MKETELKPLVGLVYAQPPEIAQDGRRSSSRGRSEEESLSAEQPLKADVTSTKGVGSGRRRGFRGRRRSHVIFIVLGLALIP